MRLQDYGVGIFQTCLTKSALKKALKKNLITVNDKPATSATFIHGGEVIKLCIPNDKPLKKTLVFALDVLFEDDYLAVIHKPAGILVSGNRFKTIAHALAQNLYSSPLGDACLPHPVHRLDYETTGALVVGKTHSSIRELNQTFENRDVEKKYFAITIGALPENGKITSSIDGKNAQTYFRRCATVPSPRFGKLNLVELKPLSGRRHQLRKHLAENGSPILGDKSYGKEHLLLQGKGLYLHAYSIEFSHPVTHEKVRIKDEIPHKFKKIFPLDDFMYFE